MVTLASAVLEELRALRVRQAEYRRLLGEEYEDYDLVFCQPNGRPLHGHNVTRRDFRRVVQRAGLPLIRFHDKVVSDLLGHAESSTTLDFYSHVLPGLKAEVIRHLEGRLLGSPEAAR
jgi:integrase